MATKVLESPRLRVVVDADFGARVTSLVDKLGVRDWMTQGGQSSNVGEYAVYSSPEAVAWDECFPTVDAWEGAATPWKRRLRDHGDVWGRRWNVEAESATFLELSYTGAEYRFVRRLTVEGDTLVADYAVTNLLGEPLPYLWALHALLAVKEGDRIELPGVETVQSSFMALGGKTLPEAVLKWHGANGVLPFALDEVQPKSAEFAAKFVLGGLAGGSARIGQAGQWLTYSWDQSIADLGIWITYGAWPLAGGHYEVALEPQSALANDLGQAIAAGAKPLAPKEERRWQVRLTVSS